MATNRGAWPQIATNHLLLAGVAFIGWIAVALLAHFRQFPAVWPDPNAPAEDLLLLVVLLGGPAFLAAGIGLARRRPWGRLLTLGLGAVAGALAVVAVVLIAVGTLPVGRPTDFIWLGLLAGYSVAVFVDLWKWPPQSETAA